MLTYSEIAANKRKTAILVTIFIVIIASLGYLFERTYNNPSIFIYAFAFSLISAYISYFYSDKITLAISRARQIESGNAPELFDTIQRIAHNASIPMPKVYVIDDNAMNAFATGRDPQHAVVCVTTGLVERLEQDELEGVLAHEISHVRNFDIRLSTVVAVLVGMLTLISDWFLRYSFWGLGGEDKKNNETQDQFQKIFFFIGLIFAIIAPIIAVIIQLAISRKREFLADASGAELMHNGEGLARALEKIRDHQKPLAEANKATAHLYFVNPLNDRKGNSRVWLGGLFNTHPSLDERIEKLRGMRF